MSNLHTVPTREQVARRLAAEKAAATIRNGAVKATASTARVAGEGLAIGWTFTKALFGK